MAFGRVGILLGYLLALTHAGATAGRALLTPRSTEVPFAYPIGGARTWPLLTSELAAGEKVRLVAKKDGVVLAGGTEAFVEIEGLRVAVNAEGKLEVAARAGSPPNSFTLEIEILRQRDVIERQAITIRAAPPTRPVTYYADFGDDLINIFGAGVSGSAQSVLHHQLREGGATERMPRPRSPDGLALFDKAGFDQYFRRLQNQGVAREILWMFPFPFISDASAYAPGDWELYQRHANAILRDPKLARLMTEGTGGIVRWGWLRDLMAFRLDPGIHRALSDSAVEHGISLAVSYRPFEHAGSKYYELPVFDADGSFLWNFQPLSSPAVNFRAGSMGFIHYREVLARMGQAPLGQIGEIALPSVGNVAEFMARYREKGDNLRVVAANFPPLQSDSLVLVRRPDGDFQLTPFREIGERVEARRRVIRNFELRHEPGRGIVITGLAIPNEYQFIIVENPSGTAPLTVAGDIPAHVISPQGNELGRNAVYLCFAGDSPEEKATRAAGITTSGDIHAVFFAAAASRTLLLKSGFLQPLGKCCIVIDRGAPISREMVDYELAPARATAVAELRTVLKHPAFREIYVNTRSHTSLSGSYGEGVDGVQPILHYLAAKKPYSHLGLDLAYAPASAVRDADVQGVATPARVLAMTQFQPGEWTGNCQSEDCLHTWRRARNRGVAAGIRALLQDLEAAFPQTRLRVVLPERESVERAVEVFQASRPPGAVGYKSSRNNYIQNIGEGMAMLDLSGLRVEPVLLGTGPFVNPDVLKAYLDSAVRDAGRSQGSEFRGPKGIMYEGQWTLKDDAGRRAREAIMCELRRRATEIGDIIVYEAADWAYRLPWTGFEFLENCGEAIGPGR